MQKIKKKIYLFIKKMQPIIIKKILGCLYYRYSNHDPFKKKTPMYFI
jgi:hypothetical protein